MRAEAAKRALTEGPVSYTHLNITFFLLYFIPGTPKDMFTWLVCLTDENVFMFLLITAVARIPSIVTSTWCEMCIRDR